MTVNHHHYPSTRRPCPVLVRQSSNSSTGSSFTVEQGKPGLVNSVTRRQRQRYPAAARRRAYIDESQNEVYFNHEEMTEEEIDATWYTAEDKASFRAQTNALVEKLAQKQGMGSWTRSVRKAYRGFEQATSFQDVQLIKQNWNLNVSPKNRGLEFRVLNNQQTRDTRRTDVLRQVEFLSTLSSDQTEYMREICRLDSRADRLFAYSLAKLAAGKEYENN